jgi:hypothetical protein
MFKMKQETEGTWAVSLFAPQPADGVCCGTFCQTVNVLKYSLLLAVSTSSRLSKPLN